MTKKTIEDTGGISVEKFDVTQGHVEIAVEYTKNLGNFENIKIRVGAGRPVKKDERPAQTVDKLFAFVGAKLVEKMNEALDDLGYK